MTIALKRPRKLKKKVLLNPVADTALSDLPPTDTTVSNWLQQAGAMINQLNEDTRFIEPSSAWLDLTMQVTSLTESLHDQLLSKRQRYGGIVYHGGSALLLFSAVAILIASITTSLYVYAAFCVAETLRLAYKTLYHFNWKNNLESLRNNKRKKMLRASLSIQKYHAKLDALSPGDSKFLSTQKKLSNITIQYHALLNDFLLLEGNNPAAQKNLLRHEHQKAEEHATKLMLRSLVTVGVVLSAIPPFFIVGYAILGGVMLVGAGIHSTLSLNARYQDWMTDNILASYLSGDQSLLTNEKINKYYDTYIDSLIETTRYTATFNTALTQDKQAAQSLTQAQKKILIKQYLEKGLTPEKRRRFIEKMAAKEYLAETILANQHRTPQAYFAGMTTFERRQAVDQLIIQAHSPTHNTWYEKASYQLANWLAFSCSTSAFTPRQPSALSRLGMFLSGVALNLLVTPIVASGLALTCVVTGPYHFIQKQCRPYELLETPIIHDREPLREVLPPYQADNPLVSSEASTSFHTKGPASSTKPKTPSNTLPVSDSSLTISP